MLGGRSQHEDRAVRAFDCGDGTHLHGENDEQVLQAARRHSEEAHAAEAYTDGQLRKWIETSGYDDVDHAPKQPGGWTNFVGRSGTDPRA